MANRTEPVADEPYGVDDEDGEASEDDDDS